MENIVSNLSIENCIFKFTLCFFLLHFSLWITFYMKQFKCFVISVVQKFFHSVSFQPFNWSFNRACVNNVWIDEHTRARGTQSERFFLSSFMISIGPCNPLRSIWKKKYFVHNHNASNAVINFALIKISTHTEGETQKKKMGEWKRKSQSVMHFLSISLILLCVYGCAHCVHCEFFN